ncbi:2Fe-2S iron-sulfur cluster-binding protein [Olsenella sp. An290]|uniref:2Fe-2S iron-sulfur cluster-binding protein n=1 Tax=Olsenella sp. An290 TaxID=1965625 RepID=UPI00117D865E|nr:2Fe-2S iron-sulfur cluster-binding protein [Olsenella sp. An290]
MKLTINGREVEAREGQSVLDAALDAGIFIPHLCKHPDLEAVGGCRLCMVEVDGGEEPVCACKTPVRDGMQVSVNGERACRELRGVGVLDYQHTERGIRIGTDGSVSLEEAGCRFCGACIEVCPTGSIIDVLSRVHDDRSREENVVPCRSGCPARIDIPRYLRHVRDGEWEAATAACATSRSRASGSLSWAPAPPASPRPCSWPRRATW